MARQGAKSKITADEVILARKVGAQVKSEVEELEAAKGSKRSVAEVNYKAQRVEIMALRVAGFSESQIAERMDLNSEVVSRIIEETLDKAVNPAIAEMRRLENQRLDRAQSAIWSEVVKGNLKAINTFLRISQQRSKVNGLYAPTKVEMNIGIKREMETALSELESLLNYQASQIVDAEVVEDLDIL